VAAHKLVAFNSQNLPVLRSVHAIGSGGRFSCPCISALVRELAVETVNALKGSLVLRRNGLTSPALQSYCSASNSISVGLSETCMKDLDGDPWHCELDVSRVQAPFPERASASRAESLLSF